MTEEPQLTIELDDLPLLETQVALTSSMTSAQVGGTVCFSIVVAVASAA